MSEPGLPTFSVTDAQYKALLPTLREVARAEETQRLARALALSLGFSFHIAICETPLIAQSLILCLAREVPALSGSSTRMSRLVPTRATEAPLSPKELTQEIFESLLGATPGAQPQISFLDATDSRSDDNDAWLWLFQRLNERRNHLYAIGHPLVFLLPPALAVELMKFAPDLWSIRSANVRLHRGVNAPEPRSALPRLDEVRLPVDRDLAVQREKVERLLFSSPGPHGLRALMVEFRRLAEGLHERGETDRAMQMLREQILPRAERAHPPELKAELMVDIVEVLVRLEQAVEAEQLARQHVLPRFKTRDDMSKQVRLLSRLADAYRYRGNDSTALQILLQEALPLAEQIHDGEMKAWVIRRAAASYLASDQLSHAQEILREQDALLAMWLPPLEYALMNVQLAEVQRDSGDPDAALSTLTERVLPNAEHDLRLQALAWHAIARAYRRRGDRQEASHLLQSKVFPSYRRLGNLGGRAAATLEMAEIQHELGRRNEALHLLREKEGLLRDAYAASLKGALDRVSFLEHLAKVQQNLGAPLGAGDLLRAELESPTLDADVRARLEAQLTAVEARGLDDGPELRHTCAGPEIYETPA